MAWVYQQATGSLFLNTIFVGAGYAGHGAGLNNPAAQDQENLGPIPAGSYTIGPAHVPADHLGPLALPLYPHPTNHMYGRFGFFMHGDSQSANKSASDGCVVIGPDIRSQVSSSGDKTLVVVSGVAARPHVQADHSANLVAERTWTDALGAAPRTDSIDRILQDPLFATLTLNDLSDVLFRNATPVNAYPDLPVVPYERTSVAMQEVVNAFNASDQTMNVKRASYVIFRNESSNGTRGINNNYCGAQADSGRWPESLTNSFSGTVTIRENGTQRLRIFLAFKAMPGNLDFLMNRVLSRGLYIGGKTHQIVTMKVDNENDLARAYHKEWVVGSADSEPGPQETTDFLSMYRQAVDLIT